LIFLLEETKTLTGFQTSHEPETVTPLSNKIRSSKGMTVLVIT